MLACGRPHKFRSCRQPDLREDIPTQDPTVLESEPPAEERSRTPTTPVVVEVQGISKTFHIPQLKVDTLKERMVHPLRRPAYRELRALRDVSFEVHRGEFFGILGRNGSGKSTLLKILASIYRPDAGRVRMAGRVAPFIELGVGFNPDLSARENCALNSVLMGLSRREAQRRLDAIIDFAELEEFIDLKVKNYSSGMMVRLAFSIMVQADPDVMLIDEVLAVGDAGFRQKCMEMFHERREAGKTIVLVTHDMTTVQSFCHRAMVIHDSEVQYLGDPEQATTHYYRLNFASGEALPLGGNGEASLDGPVETELNVRLVHALMVDSNGGSIADVEPGEPINLDVVLEAARELADPMFVFQVVNVEGVVIFAFSPKVERRLVEGQRVRLQGEIENRLVPGTYTLTLWARHHRRGGDMSMQSIELVEFAVSGTAPRHGLVELDTDLEPIAEPVNVR